MPTHPSYTIQAGVNGRRVFVTARDRADGSARTGLSAGMPGSGAAYMRAGLGRPVDVPLRDGHEHAPGRFEEVDAELLPGVYRFDIPDEALAPGASHVLIAVRFLGACVEPVEISLVAYDPQDPQRIGMRCLEWEQRFGFLRQALPRLSEQEIAMADLEPPDREG